ncbi:MAG: hypothetical protein AAB134_07245 [Pseudomonadota bacterium]
MPQNKAWLFPAAIGFLSVVLFGCASVPKQVFDPTANAAIKRIALLEIDEPDGFVLLNFGHPGMIFGAIGGAIAGTDMESKRKQLSDLLRAQEPKYGKALTDAIEQKLRAQNYDVVRISPAREQRNALVTDYTKIHTDADAILDVLIVMAGYLSQGIASDYEPLLRTSARMVSTKTQQVVYLEILAYGEKWKVSGQWVELPYVKRVSFSNFDNIIRSPKQAAEGVGDGIEPIASRITFDLKK